MTVTHVEITANARQAIAEFNNLRQSGTTSLRELAQSAGQLSAIGVSSGQQANALRQVPMQLNDIIVSLQAGQAPLTVMLQQGAQITEAFGGLGAAVRGVSGYLISSITPAKVAAAAVAATAYAYHQGSREMDAYRLALVNTGGAAGATAGQLADVARQVRQSGAATQNAASDVVAQLAGTGQVSIDNMKQFTVVALQAQKALGKSTEDMAKDFAELGKAPLQASEKLDAQYRYLTAATYAQIKALQDQGRMDEAAAVAQKAYATAMGERSAEVLANLGAIEKAWGGVVGVAKKAWDTMLDVGRPDTLAEKLENAEERLKRAKIARFTYIGSGADGKRELDAAQASVDALRKQQSAETAAARAKAESRKQEEAKTAWMKEGVQYLTKQEQLEQRLTQARVLATEAGIKDEKVIKARLDAIQREFGGGNNAAIAEAEGRRNVEKEALAGRMADLESRHRQQLVSEQAYITEKRNIQLKDLDDEARLVRRQMELAGGKGDLAERAKYLAALEVLLQRRKNIIREANNGIAELAMAPGKEMEALGRAWNRASAADAASLQDDIRLFGASAEARKIAAAQLRVDIEARQVLDRWQERGHTATSDERAELERLTAARREQIAVIMGQQQAMAGAEQLRAENRRHQAGSIADPAARARALLEVDADVWRDRIRLAGDGTAAQKALQAEFNTWYANQSKTVLTDADVTRATEALKIMEALDASARDAAAGMEASFGRVGKAIGSLTTTLTGYARTQKAIAAQLASATKDAHGDPVKVAKATAQAQQQGAQAQIKNYGDLASAAKGFFSEHTAGYRALEGVEKAYRAVEMAMAIESMATKSGLLEMFTGLFIAGKQAETAATVASVGPDVAASMAKGQAAAAAGVAAQATGDPYTAWGRMAAMAAVMAALGFAVSGGGKKDTTAQDRQKAQGTGSVLGDSSAKSESISRALDLVAANSSIELSHTAGMLASLRNIESSLDGLGNVIVRTTGITGKLPPGSAGGAAEFGRSTLGVAITGGAIGMVLDKLTGGLVGKITGSILGKVFGGKVTTQDIGITADKSALGNVLGGGLRAYQYIDQKKDGGLFRSDKQYTDLTALGSEANDQFTKVLAGLASGVTEAGRLLGVGGDAFTQQLNSFVVDLGKISLKDLKGDDIQKALESVFGKVGDDLAKHGVAGLEQFQKVGEGYFETLARVANDYASLDSILASVGGSFGATGIASVAARERLLELAGGIDELAGTTSSFAQNFLSEAERLAPVQKYVTEQLAAMGRASIDTRDEFKATVQELLNSGAAATEGGAKEIAALLALSDAFNKAYPATEKMATAQEVARSKRELEIRMMELQGDKIGALAAKREMELAEVDKSVRGMAAMVAALEDLQNAQDAYDSAVSSAKSAMQSAASQYQGFIDRVRDAGKAFAEAGKVIGDAYTKALDADAEAKKKIKAEQDKITDGYIAATEKVAAAQRKVVDSLVKMTVSLDDFITSLDTTDLAGASIQQRRTALESQFAITAAQARAGDAGAGEKLPEIAKNLLTVGKETSATAADFERLVANVRNTIAGVTAAARTKTGGTSASSEQSELERALAEQARWAEAVKQSGAAMSKSAEDLLGGYKEAVAAQKETSSTLQYWSDIVKTTGVAVQSSAEVLRASGAELVANFYNAQFELRKAQIELEAANTIRAGLELRQVTSLEEFVVAIENVNTTAEEALSAAEVLFNAAGNKLLEGSAAALKAHQAAKEGMTYWGGVVTTTAAGIAASVQAMASAASAIAAAQASAAAAAAAAQATVSKPPAYSASEAMVRDWYAKNEQYQSNGGGKFVQVQQFEVDYWMDRLKANKDTAYIKEQFALAAARDSGFSKPLPVSAFASGGDHGGGWRIVGERGPELELTGPSRIFNAGQTRDILRGNDNRALLAELQALRQEVVQLRVEQRTGDAANVSATKAQTRALLDLTNNGTSLYTTPVPETETA